MNGRVAIVTGAGRGAGIGAAIARELSRDGWSLLLTDWSAAVGQSGPVGGSVAELADSLGSGAARLGALECDLAEPNAARRVLEAAESLGEVTALVNNAAHSRPGGIEDLDAHAMDRHYAVNLRAPALLSREFATRHRGDWGRIVNITSGQGLGPMPEELAYAASKGGLEAFTVSLAAALAGQGITVNAVDPGPTDTGWMTPAQRESLLAPMGRLGTPQDAARLVRFLLSPEAGWVTGQVIRSRGGL